MEQSSAPAEAVLDTVCQTRISNRAVRLSASGVGEDLCAECNAIDLNQNWDFSNGWQSPYVQIATLAHINKASRCRLCAFFRSMRHPDWTEGRKCMLFAVSARPRLGISGSDVSRNHALLTVAALFNVAGFAPYHSGGSNLSYFESHVGKSRGRGASQILPFVDYEYLKSLVNKNKDHEEPCKHRSSCSLKVIDCKARRLVQLPTSDTHYLTLSYLWGARAIDLDAKDVASGDILPEMLPPTIEDAITITLQLGYCYLWVDRYCVPQEHGPEKERLISQMGAIFASSTLTIIVACGDSSMSGIAGVSRPRSAQPNLQLKDLHLVSIIGPKMDVHASKWNTRGWTFQEGLLARRRLVFTEKQAYFQCSTARQFETFPHWLPLAESTSEYQVFPARADGGRELAKLIEQYRSRDLTYDTDGLAAFEGVLNHVSVGSSNFAHLHGLPLCHWGRFATVYFRTEDSALPYVVNALLWRSCAKSRRRVGCPSWSWVGCQRRGDSRRSVDGNPWASITVSIMLVDVDIIGDQGDDGIRRTISATNRYTTLSNFLTTSTPPRELILTGWCFEINVAWTGDRRALVYDTISGYRARVKLTSIFGPISHFDLGQREDTGDATDRLFGLFMGFGYHGIDDNDGDDVHDGMDYSCLILEQLSEQHYERVGMAHFSFSAKEFFNVENPNLPFEKQAFREAVRAGIEKRRVQIV